MVTVKVMVVSSKASKLGIEVPSERVAVYVNGVHLPRDSDQEVNENVLAESYIAKV
jgi:hypothetical protein